MTISENIGKYKCNIRLANICGFYTREVELDIQWHSSGYYSFYYNKFEDVHPIHPDAKEDIPTMNISLDPEWLSSIINLYDKAEIITRKNPFAHYFQVHDYDRYMFDMALDTLFSAYKTTDDWVILHSHSICYGLPTTQISEWVVNINDLKKIKEFLESPETLQPFYSGCKIAYKGDTFLGDPCFSTQ